MDSEENREDDEEENWWENWDRRRRMAVVQIICSVVYTIAIDMRYVYCHRQCDESATSVKSKKRKTRAWEREFEGIREAISGVAEAIREGNAISERARQHVYTEEEVFAELVNIGVEKHLRYKAYTFLVEHPERARAFFGYPVDERKDFLLEMMYGPDDP